MTKAKSLFARVATAVAVSSGLMLGLASCAPKVAEDKEPLAIVARTVKGWGAPDEQGMGKHGTPVKKDALGKILGELDSTARDLGVADYKVDGALKIVSPKPVTFSSGKGPIKAPPFKEGLAMVGLDKDLDAGKPIAPRKAYGAALVAIGSSDKRIVGLDADVKNSTHAEWFAKKALLDRMDAEIRRNL